MGKDEGAEATFTDPAFMDENSKEFEALAHPSEDPPVTEAGSDANKEGVTSAAPGADGKQPGNNQDKDPQGILSKDGKNVIPYKALQDARANEAYSKEQLESAEQTIADLKKQLEARLDTIKKDLDDGSGSADKGQQVTDDIVSELNTLKEDFPELGKVVEVMTGQLTNMQEKLNTLEQEREAGHQIAVQAGQTAAREAMDNNPYVSLWEHEDPEAYRRAWEHDVRLRQDPVYKAKPLSDRFNKVVELVLVEYPEAKRPAKVPAKKQESDADIKKRAEKALEDAGMVDPETLSEIPGGTPPDDAQSVENLSALQLETLFEGKSQDWIDNFLAKHAD